MLALRPLVPSRWAWFRLSSSAPHLRAGLSYAVPAGLEYRVPSAAEAGSVWGALRGAEAPLFHGCAWVRGETMNLGS